MSNEKFYLTKLKEDGGRQSENLKTFAHIYRLIKSGNLPRMGKKEKESLKNYHFIRVWGNVAFAEGDEKITRNGSDER